MREEVKNKMGGRKGIREKRGRRRRRRGRKDILLKLVPLSSMPTEKKES